jgi:hypothetical protein
MSSTSNSLILTPINGEPRVHDLHLAERLGFAEPRMIRKLIKRNIIKLEAFGLCSTVERCIEVGNGVKREVEEFYLNQKQAIFICMKSETEKAFDVQAEIVRVFDAYLNGEVSVSLPMVRDLKIRDLAYCVRVFSLSRDLWSKQMMLYAIKRLSGELSLPMPPGHLLGKPSEQHQLEV